MPHYTIFFVLDRQPTWENIEAIAKIESNLIFGTDKGRPIAEYDDEHPTLVKAILSAIDDLSRGDLTIVEIHGSESDTTDA